MAYRMMTLKNKLDVLDKLSTPVLNDRRQDKYCEYITRFCSHYMHGDTQEGCKVVGSTREGIRLRLEKDDGDFDYLTYSWIHIPTEALEFRKDLPCFCHIKGGSVIDMFGGDVELVDGVYLPSSVLRDVNKKAFPLLKGLLDIFSSFESTHGRHTLHLGLKQDIKPGISKITYNGWECDELQNIPLQRKGDPQKILGVLQKAISQSPEIGQTLGPIIAVFGVMESLKHRDWNDSDAMIYQNLGPLMEAFGGNLPSNEERQQRYNRTEEPKQKYPKRDASDNTASFIGRKVLIRYRSKSSKDFIPSFMLTSPPECIVTWCDKSHKWPSQDVVDNIRRCNYYVVAKPAVRNEEMQKDFCLGCNEAEMILAAAMLPIQRKSMLLIKAFVKGVLKKFSDDITTFHWKTALYKVSESKDLHSCSDDSPGNVIKFTQEVIEYMTQSVCERNLPHFFCDSNLFAGLSDGTITWFMDKLIYLHDNIENCLDKFLIESEKKELRVEEVDGSRIQMATKTLLDDSNKSEVEGIISILSGIAEMTDDDDDDKLAEALLDIFLHAMPFLQEEMNRDKESSPNIRGNSGTSSNTESRRHLELGESMISVLSASSRQERKKAQEKLVQNLLAGFSKK